MFLSSMQSFIESVKCGICRQHYLPEEFYMHSMNCKIDLSDTSKILNLSPISGAKNDKINNLLHKEIDKLE